MSKMNFKMGVQKLQFDFPMTRAAATLIFLCILNFSENVQLSLSDNDKVLNVI